MPIFRNTVTIPVSWQIGRCPSAHIRELIRICAIASFAAADSSRSYARRQARDVIHRMVIADVLQRIRHALNKVFLPDRRHLKSTCLQVNPTCRFLT